MYELSLVATVVGAVATAAGVVVGSFAINTMNEREDRRDRYA